MYKTMLSWGSRAVGSVVYGIALFEFHFTKSIPVDGFHSTERYGSISECGGRFYMATRIMPLRLLGDGIAETRSLFHTALRTEGSGAGVVHQADEHRMSHNLALSCEGDTLYAYGGTDNRQWIAGDDHDGIYRARVGADGALNDPQRVLTGKHLGCVERRIAFGADCEFDGKLSVFRIGNQTLLFARANTVALGGGRHVQVARSADGNMWTSFEILEIEGIKSGVASNNVYFFTASHWNSTHAIASFPAVLEDGRSGVFVAYSVNGMSWEGVQHVVHGAAFGQRVELFPVGVRDGRLLIMHVNLLNAEAGMRHGVELWSYGISDGSKVRDRRFDVASLRLVN